MIVGHLQVDQPPAGIGSQLRARLRGRRDKCRRGRAERLGGTAVVGAAEPRNWFLSVRRAWPESPPSRTSAESDEPFFGRAVGHGNHFQPHAHAVLLVGPKAIGQLQGLLFEEGEALLLGAGQLLGPGNEGRGHVRARVADLGVSQLQRRDVLLIRGNAQGAAEFEVLDQDQRSAVPLVRLMGDEVGSVRLHVDRHVLGRGTVPALPIQQHRQVQAGGVQLLAGFGVGIAGAVADHACRFPGQAVQRLFPAAVQHRQVPPGGPIEARRRRAAGLRRARQGRRGDQQDRG